MNIHYIQRRFARIGCMVLVLLAMFSASPDIARADSFNGQVNRAFFTTRLKNNEPVNEVLILENNKRKLYFFSEVKNMKGKMLFHRWEYRGEKVYEQKFRVDNNSAKLVSKYKLDPRQTGEWMVVISDGRGWPIKAVVFKYVKKGSFAGKGIVPLKH